MREGSINVAIVGGGITGLALAVGLVARNISVRVYERARNFHEIGAGIGFTSNAEKAMMVVDPSVQAAFKRVATRNTSDWFQWVDGYNEDGEDARHTKETLLFEMYLGERGFEGCRRSEFLAELIKTIPPGVVAFQKGLHRIVDRGEGETLLLAFCDGTTAEADVVIGCDGIHSRVRQFVLGEDNPASYPNYSHKFAVRGLIPMERAKAVVGQAKTSTRLMHLGTDAHLLTFPVALGSLLNVVAFVTDSDEWPHTDRMTSKGTKAEVASAFASFGPTARAIIDLLPDEVEKWAVFDTYDHPATAYTRGRICISGDAAHAAAPHHGAGAGFGIEDAAALCVLIADASSLIHQSCSNREDILRTAFATYDFIRRDRTQWLVQSSRLVGEMYEWQNPQTPCNSDNFRREVKWRSRAIWDYDVEAMVHDAREAFLKTLCNRAVRD
ncbi:FAD/NAD(P)-binding domain-containing protein [Aspergillus bertholletiae]|uniref:FAD/NAD(P)-binding domain-containing protein n=1 Tax=Aspergillus bertholletiae TaxID=1226010 RepID=A0A5N7AS00_9EURO|nr:FAD/NAD(P)-binding domain-containing protein [Aspergillus bertholletiae]